jgi:hypothetical protein
LQMGGVRGQDVTQVAIPCAAHQQVS